MAARTDTGRHEGVGANAFASAGASVVPAFDIQVLRELLGDDSAVLLEVVTLFENVAAAIGGELQHPESAGGLLGAAALAHKLKSSALSVGAMPLAARCAELEKSGAAGDPASGGPLVAGVLDALEETLSATRQWRETQTAAPHGCSRIRP